jgi:hypothetical protein
MSDSLGLATLSRERSDTGSVSSGASDRVSSSRGGSGTSTLSTMRLAEHREQEKEVASRNPVLAARFDLISQRFLHMFASLCARLLFLRAFARMGRQCVFMTRLAVLTGFSRPAGVESDQEFTTCAEDSKYCKKASWLLRLPAANLGRQERGARRATAAR